MGYLHPEGILTQGPKDDTRVDEVIEVNNGDTSTGSFPVERQREIEVGWGKGINRVKVRRRLRGWTSTIMVKFNWFRFQCG